MLFKKKICPNCRSAIDEAESTCPVCNRPFTTREYNRLPNAMTWIPWWKELTIFLIGSFGLSILALLLQIIYIFAKGDITGPDSLWINFIAYFGTLCAMAGLLWMHHRGLFKSFKGWKPYVFGLAAVGAIYTFNAIYNFSVSLFWDMGNNANEQAVDSFILNMPLVSFFVVVLFGPICEELTYRVGLFSLISRVHIVLGYIATGIIFALIHFDWTCFGNTDVLINELLNLPLYMFAGLAFCFVYHKWGLASSITAHVTNNLLSFVMILLLGWING